MDFDLSQALPSPLELDEKEFESCCFDMKDVQDQIITLEKGLSLRISKNPRSMKAAATLVLAANRVKNILSQEGQSDSQRCRMILNSVIETTIVKKVENYSTGERKLVFQRHQSLECNLTDNEKKDIVCTATDFKLMALTLNAANCNHKVTFKIGTYISSGVGQTVVLSIINHNLYISCIMDGDKAELKLENYSGEDLKVICSDGAKDRFLFYRRETGLNVQTFESVMCHGWFISTSYEQEEKPLEMCKVDSAYRITSFSINESRLWR
ncbi:interleukin-1 beta [Hippoglossus hippoglossus]|uniref:interleukin-1 beta n=1 Tax=Hippoglossus hippoglossus TaxID=8267 RepID=UPI00148C26A5|nr:interleukin-1 beta [Hippoglossus hippoglossus]